MKKIKTVGDIIKVGVLSGSGVVIYVIMVALLMSLMERYFSGPDTILTIIFVLSLFVISAAITGSLVLGYPGYLFINKKFKEAIYTAFASVLTIIFFGVVTLVLMWLIK